LLLTTTKVGNLVYDNMVTVIWSKVIWSQVKIVTSNMVGGRKSVELEGHVKICARSIFWTLFADGFLTKLE